MNEIFNNWKSKNDLNKLQYAYIFIVILSLVLAGLVGLLNQPVAWQILSITWIALIAFSVNLVAFALVNLISDDTKKSQPTSKKR